MTPTPLLILSDAPSASSGLGRITRDLATRIASTMPDVFRVATLGYGGAGSSALPFFQYFIHSIEGWIVPELPAVWEDHVGQEEGILLVIWDPSRVGWLADPRQCPHTGLRQWLERTPMKKWIYGAIDAPGPFGGLSIQLSTALKGFDRVLNYSKWSSRITGYPDHLPHGINTAVFRKGNKWAAKRAFRESGFVGLKESSFLIGIVATNQARKDYALAIQTCRLLLDRGMDVRVWIHTDAVERFWNLAALQMDYGLQGRVVITTSRFSDEQMAGFYNACDVTLGIGMAEGFGYPIFESIACGTPCIHTEFSGAAEYMPSEMLVMADAFRYEGPWCSQRAVHNPQEWTARIDAVAGTDFHLHSDLEWDNLWPKWSEWLLKGLK
jgi:glycosyltransferase involved in cell wall biosynthesis